MYTIYLERERERDARACVPGCGGGMKKGLAVDVIQRDAVCVYIIMGVWVGVDGWRSFVVVIRQIYVYIYICVLHGLHKLSMVERKY